MNIKKKIPRYHELLLLLVCAINLLFLYQFWLPRRTLFFDEWQYMEEIVLAGGRFNWLWTPIQEHFSPLSKLLFATKNLFFGFAGEKYLVITVVLFLLFLHSLFSLLRALGFSLFSCAIALLGLTTTANFSEVIIWSHDKLILFCIGLFYSLRCSIKGAWFGSLFWLLFSMFSFGNGLSTVFLFFCFFGVTTPHMLLRRSLVLVVAGSCAAFYCAFLFFAYQGISHDISTRVGEYLWDPNYYLLITKVTAYSLYYGSIRPLVFTFSFPTSEQYYSLYNLLCVSLVLISLYIGCFFVFWRAQGSPVLMRVFLFGVAFCLFFAFLQNLYRSRGTYEGLIFILEWNRYSYLPSVGLSIAAASVMEALFRMMQRTSAPLLLGALLLGLFGKLLFSNIDATSSYKLPFFKSERIITIMNSFEAGLAAMHQGQTNTIFPDIALSDPIFVPGYPLKLSTYGRLSKYPWEGLQWMSPEAFRDLSPEAVEALLCIICSNPDLVRLYFDSSIGGEFAAAYSEHDCRCRA